MYLKLNVWNGWNGFKTISHKSESELDCYLIGEGTAESVSRISSIPRRGSQHSLSVADGMQVELMINTAMRMIRSGAHGPLLDENSKPIQFSLPTLLKFYGSKCKLKGIKTKHARGHNGENMQPFKVFNH